MMENTNMNIPNITVSAVVDMLSSLYANAVNTTTPFKGLPTPFLWGPAGIGKSEAVVQLADKLGRATGKTAVVTDVRLLLFSPVDLRGVPVADEHRKFTNWLMPRIFDMDPGDGVINLLFLDELSAAPQSVQAAAYQICLDRQIGEHKLPDNCIVIAAGNRTTDQSVSYKMPKALCNRLMHFHVEAQFASWRRWASEHDIDARIVGYLAFDNSKLCVEPASSDLAYPTPRSWAFASHLLKAVGGNVEQAHPLVSACVGKDTALEFEEWVRSHKHLPNVDDVIGGRGAKYPGSYDALLAFSASLVAAIRARRESITMQELENVCAYISKFPTDFALTLYNDLNAMEEIRLKLMKCPSRLQWLTKQKKRA